MNKHIDNICIKIFVLASFILFIVGIGLGAKSWPLMEGKTIFLLLCSIFSLLFGVTMWLFSRLNGNEN